MTYGHEICIVCAPDIGAPRGVNLLKFLSAPTDSSYYIRIPWGEEINFCCFICVIQRWVLHVVIKQQLFTFIFPFFYMNLRRKYKYFRFLKHMATMLEFCFRFRFLALLLSSTCDSALAYQILSELDDKWWNRDIISIFQDGSHDITNLLPVSSSTMSHIYEGQKLFAHQILTRHFNAQLK